MVWTFAAMLNSRSIQSARAWAAMMGRLLAVDLLAVAIALFSTTLGVMVLGILLAMPGGVRFDGKMAIGIVGVGSGVLVACAASGCLWRRKLGGHVPKGA